VQACDSRCKGLHELADQGNVGGGVGADDLLVVLPLHPNISTYTSFGVREADLLIVLPPYGLIRLNVIRQPRQGVHLACRPCMAEEATAGQRC